MAWWCRLSTRKSWVTSDAGSRVKDIVIIPHRRLVGQPTAEGQEEIKNKKIYIPNTNDKIHVLSATQQQHSNISDSVWNTHTDFCTQHLT